MYVHVCFSFLVSLSMYLSLYLSLSLPLFLCECVRACLYVPLSLSARARE